MKKVTDDEFIERQIRASLSPDRLVCPACGSGWVIPETYAGRVLGVCEVCWMRRKADEKRELSEALRSRRNP